LVYAEGIESYFLVAGEVDHDGMQGPPRAPVDARDNAASRRCEEDLGIVSVGEKRLAELDAIALFDLHQGPQPDVVHADQGDRSHFRRIRDDLFGLALERNVDPLVDPDRNTDRGAPPSRT
jgi:hypothetical protein